MPPALRITRRNARFQQWEALLSNRTKRQRAGELIVQGVRPISLAVAHGWDVRTLIYDDRLDEKGPGGRSPSRWAADLLSSVRAARVAMDPELLRELGGKDEDVPELVAVVAMPPDDLGRVEVGPGFLGLVVDRPTTPGNVGTMLRSLDAFGGAGAVVTGHAADPYDPRSVRASTGSLFAVPVVRTRSHAEVLAWVEQVRAAGTPLAVVGTDENGSADVGHLDLTGPTLLVIGNETSGLSAAWREACDTLARIPITGAASSLNAASAATVVLYEASRQRGDG